MHTYIKMKGSLSLQGIGNLGIIQREIAKIIYNLYPELGLNLQDEVHQQILAQLKNYLFERNSSYPSLECDKRLLEIGVALRQLIDDEDVTDETELEVYFVEMLNRFDVDLLI